MAPSQASFSAGQTILGDVHVMTPTPREHVVIEVPVAAGLEPIDTSLATESGFRDLRDGADTLWHRRELRDDRVVYYLEHMPAGAHRFRFLMRATGLGHFVIPPAQITEMYAPETFGRTGARVIDVR